MNIRHQIDPVQAQLDAVTEFVNRSIYELYGDECPMHHILFVSPGPNCYVECPKCREEFNEPVPPGKEWIKKQLPSTSK